VNPNLPNENPKAFGLDKYIIVAVYALTVSGDAFVHISPILFDAVDNDEAIRTVQTVASFA
jgi:hypothetical protein